MTTRVRRWQFISEGWRLGGLPAYRPACPACGWTGPADQCRPSVQAAANLAAALHPDCPAVAVPLPATAVTP